MCDPLSAFLRRRGWSWSVGVLVLSALVGLSTANAEDGPTLPAFVELRLSWPLDDVGLLAADASGHNLTGQAVGGAIFTGTSLSFTDGPSSGQYLYVGDSELLTGSTVVLDYWLYPTRPDVRHQMIVNKYQPHNPGNSDYAMWLDAPSAGVSTITLSSRGTEGLQAELADASAWHHVIGIIDGARSELWVDGVLVSAGFLSTPPNGTQPLVLGGCRQYCEGHWRTFSGEIRGFRVLAGTFSAPPDETILRWSFDQGDPRIVLDLSTQRNDGFVRAGAVPDPADSPDGSAYSMRFLGGASTTAGIEVADNPTLSSPVLTIDLWMKPTRFDQITQVIVNKYQPHAPGNSEYMLALSYQNLVFLTAGTESISVPLGDQSRWYHVIAIADGPDSVLYVDGVPKSGSLSVRSAGTQPLVLGGCRTNCEGHWTAFSGWLDAVTILRVRRDPNSPPIADAGDDAVVEATGLLTPVPLDGTGSYDPDGDALSWGWTGVFGAAFGATPVVNLPVGEHEILLIVTDTFGQSDEDWVSVRVADTQAPVITSLAPNRVSLWPPNHEMIPLTVLFDVTDVVDPAPACEIAAISSSEPAYGLGDGDTAPDWWFSGLSFALRSERAGSGAGRTYTVTLRCEDASGNASEAVTTVVVPHSRGKQGR